MLEHSWFSIAVNQLVEELETSQQDKPEKKARIDGHVFLSTFLEKQSLDSDTVEELGLDDEGWDGQARRALLPFEEYLRKNAAGKVTIRVGNSWVLSEFDKRLDKEELARRKGDTDDHIKTPFQLGNPPVVFIQPYTITSGQLSRIGMAGVEERLWSAIATFSGSGAIAVCLAIRSMPAGSDNSDLQVWYAGLRVAAVLGAVGWVLALFKNKGVMAKIKSGDTSCI